MISIVPSKHKQEKAHLRNLVIMAKADNYLDLKEINCIYKIGRRLGLSERHIDDTLHASKNEPYAAPELIDEKFSQLYDLIEVMLADGIIDEKESVFCAEIATQMGFRKAVSGLIITKITRCMDQGLTKEETFDAVEPFLS